MSIISTICKSLCDISNCIDLGNGDMAVNTQCLYPSNAVVQVTVRSVNGSYLVSDDGGAIREAITAGLQLQKSSYAKYGVISNKQGLSFHNGVVSAPVVSIDAVPYAVVLVANSSKEIADQIFSHYRTKRVRDFRSMVTAMLELDLQQKIREESIPGQSTRTYRFENVFSLPSGRKAIVDPVLRDPNSINARVIANLDVREASQGSFVQRIVYDDEDRWENDDLNVLQMTGVSVVPFSKAKDALKALLVA